MYLYKKIFITREIVSIMLISCRCSVIGLHLLLLTHIAHTFVLLTANMDDVKKLARKFVSESLAEKIAEFIASATQQMVTNVSEENDMNPDVSHQVSEENNMYNIGRQGSESAAQDNIKSKEETSPGKPEDLQLNSSSDESNKAEIEIPDTETEKAEKLESHKSEKPNRYPAEPVTQYAYPLQELDKKKSKISEEDERYNKDIKENKYLEDNFVTTQSTTSYYAEKYLAANNPVRKKVKGRPYRLLSHVDTVEDNEVEPVETNKTLDDFSENERFGQNRAQDLTTRKAVYEFDQYDNKNYPKSEFVATSGPVILRKINDNDPDNWWEKKMPGSEDKRRTSFE